MPLPKVSPRQAEEFSKVWTHNGVAIILTDVHFAFAANFTQILLTSFIEQANVEARQRRAAAEAAKVVVVEG